MGNGTTRKKHIVYAVSDTAYGGGTRYFSSLVTGLDADRYTFGAACKPGTGLESHFRDLGVQVYPFPVRSRFDIRGMIRFARFLRGKRVDCLLLGDGTAWNSGFFIRMLSGIPQVWAIVHMTHIGLEIRTFGKFERILSAAYDFIWSLFCNVIVVSNQKNADILASEGVNRGKLEIIPNCIEYGTIRHKHYQTREALMAKHGIAGQPRIIGMVARLGPGKDFDTLLAAAVRVSPCRGLRLYDSRHRTLAGRAGTAGERTWNREPNCIHRLG